jgi:protein-tyrosine phosphatase
MFGIFKKSEFKKNITFDYSSLMVDMHSHVLPGIDDGAQTPQESIALIKKMMQLGIKKIIATPHIMADYYKNKLLLNIILMKLLKAVLMMGN